MPSNGNNIVRSSPVKWSNLTCLPLSRTNMVAQNNSMAFRSHSTVRSSLNRWLDRRCLLLPFRTNNMAALNNSMAFRNYSMVFCNRMVSRNSTVFRNNMVCSTS